MKNRREASLLKGVAVRYLRWRHSKGFGVHSPFAYRFVTDVVNPGNYGYYAYSRIGLLLKGAEKTDANLISLVRFLIRLSIFLNAKRIVSAGLRGRESEIAASALGIPFTTIQEACGTKVGDLIFFDKTIPDKLLKESIEKGIAIFARNPDAETNRMLTAPLSRGLLLKERDYLLLIPRKEMAYLSYDMDFGI
ncbi:MAG: hypothetical protein J1F38_11215 [Muribaculaceae bacterium]|nr:hypothetical protein [Muribaculaceae bacterium]